MNKLEEYNFVNAKNISSKTRLMRLVEISGISKKEGPETYYALKVFRKYIKSTDTVADIASGHGLVGCWISWMGLAERVNLYDKRYLNKLPAAYCNVIKHKPYLKDRIKVYGKDISADEDIEGDVLIGVHACGDLTDFILRLAVKNNIPFAVMTCCHGKIKTGAKRCNLDFNANLSGLGIKSGQSIDLNRALWVANQNYKVDLKKIPKGITGEPLIIAGRPR